MRFHCFLVLLVVFTGISVAQETNFPVGPQYLITAGDPLFYRPIQTPSLSLSGDEVLAGTSAVPRPVELPDFAPVETLVYLGNVYWGEHNPDEVLGRRLEPPIMTADQTAWYMNYVASQARTAAETPFTEQAEGAIPPASSTQAFEAAAGPTVIELAGGPVPANLPSSLFDTGVTGMTDMQSQLERGYGLSLGEVAAYWKTHRRQAPHIFTNQDVHRK